MGGTSATSGKVNLEPWWILGGHLSGFSVGNPDLKCHVLQHRRSLMEADQTSVCVIIVMGPSWGLSSFNRHWLQRSVVTDFSLMV